MDIITIIQNIAHLVTSTLGIALITACLGVAFACKMMHMAHTWGPTIDVAVAGALLISLASVVNAVYG